MRLPWVGRILGNLMGSVHDVALQSLGEVIQVANNAAIIEVQIEGRSVLACMEWHGYLGWHWLDLHICEIDILDDGIHECALCELVGPITHLLDVDTNIVS